MGFSSIGRVAVCVLVAGLVAGCHRCGLGAHDRVTLDSTLPGAAGPCCPGSAFRDVSLQGQTSGAEFSLANTAFPAGNGGVDAFIVATSCGRLFDGEYPGSAPLCPILAGPAKPGGVSGRVKLSPGTYRVYIQGYSGVAEPVRYLVDVYTWDYRCRGMIP